LRKLTFIDGTLLATCIFALALVGCAGPKETESTAPAPAAETASDTAAPAAADTAATAAAGDTAAPATASDTATPASAATAATQTPATLEAQISAKLVDSFGDDAKTITITNIDGKVILTGKVKARSTQELAEQVALYFPEVKKVDNQLMAEGDRGLGKGQLQDESADAAVETAAKNALKKEIGEYAKGVEVEVAAGVVALRGTVPDAARHKLAVDAMARVKDVTKVVDLLRVK
jgi:osmotically-inducible protein OsmY